MWDTSKNKHTDFIYISFLKNWVYCTEIRDDEEKSMTLGHMHTIIQLEFSDWVKIIINSNVKSKKYSAFYSSIK